MVRESSTLACLALTSAILAVLSCRSGRRLPRSCSERTVVANSWQEIAVPGHRETSVFSRCWLPLVKETAVVHIGEDQARGGSNLRDPPCRVSNSRRMRAPGQRPLTRSVAASLSDQRAA